MTGCRMQEPFFRTSPSFASWVHRVRRNSREEDSWPLFRVINRSQKDIIDDKGIDDAVAAEQQFFASHSAYQDMADSLVGRSCDKSNSLHVGYALPATKA